MIIKPEKFVEEYKNKSYSELIKFRDEIIEEIRAFERHDCDLEKDPTNPSPKEIYKWNLEYLEKLCELISKKYSKDTNKDTNFLEIMSDFLVSNNLINESLIPEIVNRKNGKKYTIQDHIRGMVYSLLTNQTKWSRVEPHLQEIDTLFYNYDPDKILSEDPSHFYKGLFELKCGNISTKAQMESLGNNIKVFRRMECEYGSIDSFITSDTADIIVQKLSKDSSSYKMKMVGEALAWEYLRNVGVDGAKPDTHLRRFLGADRMGTGKNSPATANEVIKQIDILSKKTGMFKVEIDNLIWSFCADGFGEICTATPHCEKCPIREFCKRG